MTDRLSAEQYRRLSGIADDEGDVVQACREVARLAGVTLEEYMREQIVVRVTLGLPPVPERTDP